MTKEITIMIAPALQKKVLLLLVALWAVIIGVMLLWGSKENKVAAAPAVSKNSPARPAAAKATKARGELDLPLWERKQEPMQAGSHNPFHPLAGYLEPPPPPPGAKLKVLPPPPDPFIEELKTFKYFGYAEDQSKKVAFLGKGNNSYTVKEKDIVEGKFLVKKITDDYVILGEPQGPKELTIAQSGFGEGGAGSFIPSRPFYPAPGGPVFPPSLPPFLTPPPARPAPAPLPTPQERRGPKDRPFPMPPRAPLSKGGE